jgi:hypothetical protein
MSIDEQIAELVVSTRQLRDASRAQRDASEAQREKIEAQRVNIESLHANLHELWETSQRHDAALAVLTTQMNRLAEAMTRIARITGDQEDRLRNGGL